MGWRPDEVRACSVADFNAAVEGFSEANGLKSAGPAAPMTRAELEDLMAKYPDAPARDNGDKNDEGKDHVK